MLHAASALLVALADWLIFGLNITTTMHAYRLVNVSTALVAGAPVMLAQRYAKERWPTWGWMNAASGRSELDQHRHLCGTRPPRHADPP